MTKWIVFLLILWENACENITEAKFVRIVGREFYIGDQAFYFSGVNYWQMMNVVEKQIAEDVKKFIEMNTTCIRVILSTQGPETEPYRMIINQRIIDQLRIVPTLQNEITSAPNAKLLAMFDKLLDQIRKQNTIKDNFVRVVVMLQNFWCWSGGMAQYVHWCCNKEKPIPYPPDTSLDEFKNYTKEFYRCPEAIKLYKDFIKKILQHTNKLMDNKPNYENPFILGWEIANDPIPYGLETEYTQFLEDISKYIKEIDSNHLVTIGSGGKINDPNFKAHHELENIDYITAQIWPEDFGWYHPTDEKSFEKAKSLTLDYIRNITNDTRLIRKPLVFDAVAISRDNGSFDPTSTTKKRDEYYSFVYENVFNYSKVYLIQGLFIWGYSGSVYPTNPGQYWKVNENITGDPPDTLQGRYSIYDSDITTCDTIKDFGLKMKSLPEIKPVPFFTWLAIIGVAGVFIVLILIFVIMSCRSVPKSYLEAKQPEDMHLLRKAD